MFLKLFLKFMSAADHFVIFKITMIHSSYNVDFFRLTINFDVNNNFFFKF